MPWMPRKRVVVPIDGSEPSHQALATALELAAPGDVYMLHVVEPLTTVYPGVSIEEIDESVRATPVRNAVAERLAKLGVETPPLAVRRGNPGLTICDYASELGADLIVIASHGRTGLKRLLIGSVAEVVVRHAPCPVLVLRREP